MRLAILAWGSLYWDPQDLAIKEKWQSGGPILPIEFARISQNGRLTLVITEEFGTAIETYWALSKFNTIDEAFNNLKKREGTKDKGIGKIDFTNKESPCIFSTSSKAITTVIEQWGLAHNFDAVIWTDLPSNFSEKSNLGSFSFERAKLYLDGLTEKDKAIAFEYIEKAPEATKTKLRQYLADNI